jgi:hypothetical protein
VGESGWLFPALPARVVFSRKQLSDVGIKKHICRMRFTRTKQQFIIAIIGYFLLLTQQYT